VKEPVRIAVLGAGLIGRRHIQHVKNEPKAKLVAIVDPSFEAKALAESLGLKWSADYEALLKSDRPDGAIIATPNMLHLSCGLASVEAGVPALVEKPIADDVLSATRLVDAAEKRGVPLLVGHHRRYNPLIRKAKEISHLRKAGSPPFAGASFLRSYPGEGGTPRERSRGSSIPQGHPGCETSCGDRPDGSAFLTG